MKTYTIPDEFLASASKREQRLRSGKPKKALSAFMYFTQAKRAETREAHPGITFGEIAKIMGAMWKDMSEADRKPYVDLAEADKVRYAGEMKVYTDKKAEEAAEAEKAAEEKRKQAAAKRAARKAQKQAEAAAVAAASSIETTGVASSVTDEETSGDTVGSETAATNAAMAADATDGSGAEDVAMEDGDATE